MSSTIKSDILQVSTLNSELQVQTNRKEIALVFARMFFCATLSWDRILETMTLDLACEKYLLSLFNSSF